MKKSVAAESLKPVPDVLCIYTYTKEVVGGKKRQTFIVIFTFGKMYVRALMGSGKSHPYGKSNLSTQQRGINPPKNHLTKQGLTFARIEVKNRASNR